MLIQDRIQMIIKANNLTASEFASNIDVKRSNLSHVLSGRNKPSLDFLSKVITAYPNVNASWLLTGETREGVYVAQEAKKESVYGYQAYPRSRIGLKTSLPWYGKVQRCPVMTREALVALSQTEIPFSYLWFGIAMNLRINGLSPTKFCEN